METPVHGNYTYTVQMQKIENTLRNAGVFY